MNWKTRGSIGLGLFAAVALLAVGCESKTAQNKDSGKQVVHKDGDKDDHSKGKTGDTKHAGWWCDEHGIPEEECSMCSAKVAAEFKKKGDWCEKHDRAKSQCFLCDPKLKEKYAAKYRAKYGKEPPPTEEEKDKKDDKGK